MSARSRPPFRADQVDSLLRPEALKQAREQFLGPQTPQSNLGPHDNAALRAVEDRCIRECIAMQELKALVDAGARYIQMDDTSIAFICDPAHREFVRSWGQDPEQLLQQYAERINSALAEVPDEVTVTLHQCRGNREGSWAAEGGYDPVAEVLFNQVDVDGYFLEYDSSRAGGFEPLRFLPKGKQVVLGLVSSKTSRLEDETELLRRIEAAARFAPLEQLCLSPQCGFASSIK